MRTAILRWTIYLLALFVFGPLAGMLTGSLRATDGGPDATLLVNATPAMGILVGLGAVAIALAVGIGAALLLGAQPGMTATGLVLAWSAWRTGDVLELIRTAHSAAPLRSLALEGLLFGLLAIVVASAVTAVGRRLHTESARRLFGEKPLPVLAVGLVAGAIAAWLVAVTPLKGQAVISGVAAGIFAAAAGRLVDPQAPIPILAAPVFLLAALAPLSGFLVRGHADVVHAAYAGALFPTANITPLDWIAGAFLGVPFGISWATSLASGRVGP